MPAADLRDLIGASRADQIADWTLMLVQAASPNPPGDTGIAAKAADSIIRAAVPDVEVELHEAGDQVVNLIARVHGAGPGRRVVFNGHLDTYPVGDASLWTRNPAGERDGNRLYGRGSADMKGGIAASISAFRALAAHRDRWHGEVVLTLAGDEESMGPLGTRWLLDRVPHATGNAAIIADTGSPRVLRFGEKGFLWIEIEAVGRTAHGAHVHLGENAVERLLEALTRLQSLRGLPVQAPVAVMDAIARSRAISEPLAGAGEAVVLSQVTVNIGWIDGGTSTNLVPAIARAGADIRLPVGITAAVVEQALAAALERKLSDLNRKEFPDTGRM